MCVPVCMCVCVCVGYYKLTKPNSAETKEQTESRGKKQSKRNETLFLMSVTVKKIKKNVVNCGCSMKYVNTSAHTHTHSWHIPYTYRPYNDIFRTKKNHWREGTCNESLYHHLSLFLSRELANSNKN